MIVEFESLPRHQFKAYSAESESKRAETQMQDRVRFEMANIKQTRLKMEEKQESSLSERDKENIKWAVLRAVENGCLEPELIAQRCCSAIEIINRNGLNTGNGSISTSSNSA